MLRNDPANQVSHTQSSTNANITESSQSALSITRSSSTITPAGHHHQQPGSRQPYSFSNYLGSLSDRIGDLCESTIFSDVTFRLGSSQEQPNDGSTPTTTTTIMTPTTSNLLFPAHKVILAIASPVFAAMFYGPLRSPEDTTVVVIPDCKPQAFKCLLQFVYRNELCGVTDVQVALDTLYCARKYSMRLLEDGCLAYLGAHVTAESVLAVREAAERYNLPDLQAACTDYVEENAYQVLRAHCPFLTMEAIVQFTRNERLNLREIELFGILLDWADEECKGAGLEVTGENRREILRPVLYDIRFPAMSAAEVADVVVPSGILSSMEVAQVLTFISASDKGRVEGALPFTTMPRGRGGAPMMPASSSTLFPELQEHPPVRMPRHRSRKRSRNR